MGSSKNKPNALGTLYIGTTATFQTSNTDKDLHQSKNELGFFQKAKCSRRNAKNATHPQETSRNYEDRKFNHERHTYRH